MKLLADDFRTKTMYPANFCPWVMLGKKKKKKKRFVSWTFAKNAKCYAFFFFFFFLENEQCGWGNSFFIVFLAHFFFSNNQKKKKKAKNLAQRVGLCSKSDSHTYARGFVRQTFFFLA